MAKMNALKKKAAVKKYSEAVTADITAAEAQMKADGYTDEEIAEVIEAITNPVVEETTDEAPAKPAKEKPAKKAEEKPNANLKFEKTEVRYDKDGKVKKGDVLRIVKISQEKADILNSQMHNTKLGYFLIEE
jgi:hypothetical protein